MVGVESAITGGGAASPLAGDSARSERDCFGSTGRSTRESALTSSLMDGGVDNEDGRVSLVGHERSVDEDPVECWRATGVSAEAFEVWMRDTTWSERLW